MAVISISLIHRDGNQSIVLLLNTLFPIVHHIRKDTTVNIIYIETTFSDEKNIVS